MVQQVQAPVQQQVKLRVALRQETDVQVRRRQVHLPRLGGINASKGRPHIVHRVGVVQFLPQLDHLVIQLVLRLPGILRYLVLRAGRHRGGSQHQQGFPIASHSTNRFLAAKLRIIIRVPPKETFICKRGLPGPYKAVFPAPSCRQMQQNAGKRHKNRPHTHVQSRLMHIQGNGYFYHSSSRCVIGHP